jgi:hypothetical protein
MHHHQYPLDIFFISVCLYPFSAQILIFPRVLLNILHVDGWKSSKQSLIAVLRLQLLLVGVEKFSLSQSPKANCHMLLSLGFEEVTSYPSSTESVFKIFSNWESNICWFAILLQNSCCLETSLTQLWNKPRLKHVQISNVIDTCPLSLVIG